MSEEPFDNIDEESDTVSPDHEESVDTSASLQTEIEDQEEDEIIYESVDEEEDVDRIPWKEYLKSQFRNLLGLVGILLLLTFIINLSMQIPPSEVLSVNNINDILLMGASSLLFLSILGIFTKIVLINHKEEFGIKRWKSPLGILTFLLTTSFISLVYILLDVSLVNIYLMTLPTYVVWFTPNLLPSLGQYIPTGIDRIAYSTIRSYFFIILLGFIFIFPVVMFIRILTRIGRNQIAKRREKESSIKMKSLLPPFFGIPIGVILLTFIYLQIEVEAIGFLLLFIILVGSVIWVVVALLFLFTLIRFTIFLTWSNILLIFPFIFLFYILPGLLWGLWDLFVISSLNTTENTIYGIFVNAKVGMDPNSIVISQLTPGEIVQFYLQTVFLNLGGVLRIIQLDFIIIIGLSAIAIGFAEGYSILAILKSISTGVSIAKTGKVAKRSAPKMIVISTRLAYLMAWLGYFWDKMVVVAQTLADSIRLELPMVGFPRLFSIVIDLGLNITALSDQLVLLSVLIVPFYFIISSAFKFLSVSIALERLKEDRSAYYLLISSAYILIVTNILAEITALPSFQGEQKPFLPLSGIFIRLLPFITKIFELLESFAFYIGFLVSIVFIFKRLFDKDEKIENDIE